MGIDLGCRVLLVCYAVEMRLNLTKPPRREVTDFTPVKLQVLLGTVIPEIAQLDWHFTHLWNRTCGLLYTFLYPLDVKRTENTTIDTVCCGWYQYIASKPCEMLLPDTHISVIFSANESQQPLMVGAHIETIWTDASMEISGKTDLGKAFVTWFEQQWAGYELERCD